MKLRLGLVALLALSASSLFAQEETRFPVSLGFKVGIPVTDMFSTSNTTLFGSTNTLPGTYTSAVPRYEFGVSGEIHIPYGLRLEVDGLFKRGGFDSSSAFGAGSIYSPTTFNQWEIPALVKKNLALGHYRPFVEIGASLRHISTIDQTRYGFGPIATLNNNAVELHNRNTVGGVAGFGITFKRGPFELTPEARYTRWANQSFTGNGLRTNLDQGDVLLGITF